MTNQPSAGFLSRNEFLLRRLHSLTGLIPVGAYMVIHLMTNASVLNGASTFQRAVYQIHSLGAALPVIEWGFIFLPLLFHAIFGVVIIRGGLPNNNSYHYASNVRYTLQRASGMVAMVFILYHVFHMHGWLHSEWWLEVVAGRWGGAKFAPYNATSTAAEAVQQSAVVSIFYVVGIAACVFHLANGLWTMGITWGVWITPAAQKRASTVCTALGLLLLVVSLSAWSGFALMGEEQIEQARQIEATMFKARVESGELDPDKAHHKQAGHHNSDEVSALPGAAPAGGSIPD